MRSIEVNDNKIYELTRENVVPEYLNVKRQQKLKKKDKLISNRLEVIHDLSMPDIATNISLSPDGNYLFILGAYSPRIRCYELEQMSMKFERNVDELPTKIAFIERGYTNFVVLEGEKTLAFHNQGGIHKKIKCDDVATDLIFSKYNDSLYIPTSKGNIAMVNVNSGKFYDKYITGESSEGINCACYNDRIDLFMCGTRSGLVEGYDARTSKKIYNIDITNVPNPEDVPANYKSEITKMNFKNPLIIGVGTDKGVCHLYDIRNNSKPWSSRDLDYRRPIRSIIFHDDKVIAALGSVFKIWEPKESQEGDIFASYDTNKQINDFFNYPNSGLFFAATNDSVLPTYFIPRLGDAPRWCQQLSNLIITTEVESHSMYDTHTFVTLEELDLLNLKHLIGTPSLRAYTHGYYISNNTYMKTKNALDQLKVAKDEVVKEYRFASENNLIDNIPDPKMNVAIKALSTKARFSSLFTEGTFTVDPSSREFQRIILETKYIEKKRQKKINIKESASRANKLAKLDDSESDTNN